MGWPAAGIFCRLLQGQSCATALVRRWETTQNDNQGVREHRQGRQVGRRSKTTIRQERDPKQVAKKPALNLSAFFEDPLKFHDLVRRSYKVPKEKKADFLKRLGCLLEEFGV